MGEKQKKEGTDQQCRGMVEVREEKNENRKPITCGPAPSVLRTQLPDSCSEPIFLEGFIPNYLIFSPAALKKPRETKNQRETTTHTAQAAYSTGTPRSTLATDGRRDRTSRSKS